MADSGARGSTQQIRQLAGMRGLMAKPSGEIIETPITANFREGLSVLQYFISTHGARKGLADTALKTANSGYLTRRLVDVAQDAIITEYDCGTINGIEMEALTEGGEIIEPLSERILGRVTLEDVLDPLTRAACWSRPGPSWTRISSRRSRTPASSRLKIRDVLTCETDRGVCAECYGRDLARGRKVNLGEAVGVIAAQSIGEPGTQLTMRTFHIGGTSTNRAQQSTLEARNAGKIVFHNLAYVDRPGGLIVKNRNGEVSVVDDSGRERERYSVIYGAKVMVREGTRVQPNHLIAEWDPYTSPILTEVGGIVKFGDIIEGVTMSEQMDEVTGLSRRSIIEPKDPDARPRISIKDEKGETKLIPGTESHARYLLPVGFNITVSEGDEMQPGDVVAKIPRETTKTKDITTGGLPRVAELFEALQAEGGRVVITEDRRHRLVRQGHPRRAERKIVGDAGGRRKDLAPISLGSTSSRSPRTPPCTRVTACGPARGPYGRLRQPARHSQGARREGAGALPGGRCAGGLPAPGREDQRQAHRGRSSARCSAGCVSRIQGTPHSSRTSMLEKHMFDVENGRVLEKGGAPAQGEPLLLGITKASLSTESFISASSFQETHQLGQGSPRRPSPAPSTS